MMPSAEDAAQDEPRQRAVLVLGAGRSGTSIVTRAMQAVGVDLGDDFKPPSRKNPTGYFEDTALLKLSKRLRRTLGLRPDSLRLLDDDVWTSPAVMPFYDEFSATIKQRFGDAPIWGFKYARTMRLLPFWERLFVTMDIAPSYVMPIRNPLSVARSRAKLDAHRGVQENSDLEWLVNVVPYFDIVRDRKLVVIDYDNLMENSVAQLERLAVGLGLAITDQTRQGIETFTTTYLRPSLQHSRFSIEELQNANNINVLVRDAYCLLDHLSRDEIRSDDPGLWSSWEKLTTDLNALGPILSQTDQLNHELRLARWNPFSFVAAGRDLVQRFLRG
jgi:hypothetical protein